MKATDKLSMSMGIVFTLLLGGLILINNKAINAAVESSEIKEATIVQSLVSEHSHESIYDRITNEKHHLIFKEVSVNKHIVIDSNNNGIRDDNDIVFDSHFSTNLPWHSDIIYFDSLPSELKEEKELKNIKKIPKYIVNNNKLYVYLLKEGSNMIYLNNKFDSIPLAVKNQNGKYDILNLPSKMYGKKGKELDKNLYDIIETKQDLR